MHRTKVIIAALVIASVTLGAYFLIQPTRPAPDRSRAIVDAYLRATYARNFAQAYEYLSAADRQVRSRPNFAASQGAYRGFTLEVAQHLAGFMEIWTIDRQARDGRLVIKTGYRIPAPAELNDLLLNWDEDRLNALPIAQQKTIIAALDSRKQAGKLLTIEGQETIELIEEPDGWKIFLDWAASTRVLLRAERSEIKELEVRFAAAEIFAKSDELFLVNVKIKNPTARAVTFTVGHRLEPAVVADDLQLVECGLLTPTTIEPNQEKEFAMAYLLGGTSAQHHREVKLTYEFKPR